MAGLPALSEFEGRAADFVFRAGRPNPPPPSDRIVHLDIDDNALDSVGRWPWPRGTLAAALRALDGLGTRVVALDLLLVDPQQPQYLPDGTRIDHDRLLAATLADMRARTILAVKIDESGTRLGPLWQGGKGAAAWRRILAALRADINRDADTVVRRAAIGGKRAVRVREQIHAIKRIVIRDVADELFAAGKLDEDALRAALLPADKNARLKRFPELYAIRNAIAHRRAIARMDASMPSTPVPGMAGVEDVIPPLLAFVEAADGFGVVNAEQDPDGTLRRVTTRWARAGRAYPQFGVAAAAAYLDAPREALAREPLALGRRFELRGHSMILSWPAFRPERPILDLAPHVSLGRVIDLVRNEQELARQQEEHDTLTRSLLSAADFGYAPQDLDDPAKRPLIEAEIGEQVAWWLDQGELDDEALERAARRWSNLDIALERGRLEIGRARVQLRDAVSDRLVFIGWNATGNFGDFYPTAIHERTPGIVAHAVVANSVLSGYVLRPAPAWAGFLSTLLLGLAAALLTHRTGPRLAFLLVLLIAVSFVAVQLLVVLDRWHVLAKLTTPLIGLGAGWAGTLVLRALRELREKAQLRRQFGARISKQLFDFLLEHPDQVHLEGEEREVTCFFSDLAGFTAISERLDSRTTVALLNRYMWSMNDELTKYDAYVNKFLGDGIMSVWGAFTTGGPHAELACRAALGCLRRLERLNAEPEFEGFPKLSMRIGIATGVVTLGDCGAPPDLRDYTVIGDAANLAARLESASKQFGTRILLDGRTRELAPDDLLARPLGRIAVVGQQAPTDVHELVAARDEATDEQLAWIERTREAVEAFAAGELEGAFESWRGLLPSPLAELYLEEIERARAGSAPTFDGVLRLTKK